MPSPAQSPRRMLERVLAAYREQDWDTCIRRVRILVEVTPLADGPRQLLASLYVRNGNARGALLHYGRLLGRAAARGSVLRALYFQKRIDELTTETPVDEARWKTLQGKLRERGLPHVSTVSGADVRPWAEAQLLALPNAVFERVAAATTMEVFGLEPITVDADSDTIWEVLAGRLRWSFALPDGRASAEVLASEGEAVRVDPDLARRAVVTFTPELPVECLRFDPSLVAEIRGALAALRLPGAGGMGLTSEGRALLPSRPRRFEDIDRPVVPPLPASSAEPPRLETAGSAESASEAKSETPPADPADWLEHGMLSLDARDTAAREAARGETPAPDAAAADPSLRERTVELPSGDATPARKPGRPVVERPGPVEMGDGLIVPPTPDPFAAPIPDVGQPIERRRGSRVAASFTSRIAMLRLAGTKVTPAEGTLFDLSTTGLGVRFTRRDIGTRRRALLGSIVAVELDMPGDSEPLRVAGQVRWIEMEARPLTDGDAGAGDDARLGIEFVLLTEPDRRRIAGALARAAAPAANPSPVVRSRRVR